MLGFFIKKSFFDGWDNLIGMVLHNLGYLVVLLALFGSMSLSQSHLVLSVASLVLTALLFALYTAGVSASAYAYSKYERIGFSGFYKGLKHSIRHALLFWVLTLLDASLIVLVIPFYLSFGNAFGTILSVILFWVFIGLFLALMYFYPLSNIMSGDRPLKTLKKSFLIVFDNLWFSLFLAFDMVVSFVISIFLAGLAPGGCGILLEGQDATRLLMLKYDYLEANPDEDKRKIPWDELLYDEQECVGHRSLKNMIFPWKD
jgi:hypothetical protein